MPRWYTSTGGNHRTPIIQDPGTMMAIVASGKESPAIVAIVAMRNRIDNSGI